MTSVFYSIVSDTANYARGYTPTADMAPVALSGDYYDLNNLPDLGSTKDIEFYVNLGLLDRSGGKVQLERRAYTVFTQP